MALLYLLAAPLTCRQQERRTKICDMCNRWWHRLGEGVVNLGQVRPKKHSQLPHPIDATHLDP